MKQIFAILALSLPLIAIAKPLVHDTRTGHKADQILFTRTLTEGAEVMKIDYFQLAREDMASQAINRITMRLLNRYTFPCGDGKDASEEGEITLVDRNPLTVSLDVSTSWSCGAYPDGIGSTNTYEIKTGRRIKIANELADDQAREKVKQLVFTQFKRQQAKDKEQVEACADATGIESFDLTGGSFGVKGDSVVYTLSNSLPHALKACGDDVSIKITDITTLLKKDSILRKIVK